MRAKSLHNRILAIFLFVAWVNGSLLAQEITPANPKAIPEAAKVLTFLTSIQGKKMLSGHHVMYGGMQERDLRYIQETTGKVPALLEFEGGIFARKYHEEYTAIQDQIVRDAVAHWKQGGIVALCWHWGNPLEPKNTYPNTKIPFDIQAALKDGTPEHEAMMKDLDVTAVMLKKLQDARVPVLFRPLHEIDGGWFWWSKQGEETAEKLWTFIYTYYTDYHRLNNLLWVYSYSHEMRMDWFPGLDRIDIIGVDIYKEGQTDQVKNYRLMESVAGGKPVALSECEEIPDPDVMKESGFLWQWFTTWHSRYLRKNSPDFLKKVYHHDLVYTLDEMPKWE